MVIVFNILRRPDCISFCLRRRFFLEVFVGARIIVTLACRECKQRNYSTTKNKRSTPDKLGFNKYCRFCRKHTFHKEIK